MTSTGGPSRVFLLNNYSISMGHAERRVRDGEYPGQHLWGMWELRDRFEWVLPPRTLADLPRHARLRRAILTLLLPLVGDLLQEWFVLRRARPGDVVYAADQQTAVGLALLRRLRVLRVPLVVLVHNGPRLAWTRWCYSGVDRLLCLSEGIRRRLSTHTAAPLTDLEVVPWGPSLTSPFYARYQRRASPALDFVAAGKTNRDYRALLTVASRERLSGIVFAAEGVHTVRDGVLETQPGRVDYDVVLQAMQDARWVVIPLADPDRLSGLTEAADAIALRVPTIVSPTDLFPMCSAGFPVFADATDCETLARALAAQPPPSGSFDAVRAEHGMCVFATRLETVLAALCAGERA